MPALPSMRHKIIFVWCGLVTVFFVPIAVSIRFMFIFMALYAGDDLHFANFDQV